MSDMHPDAERLLALQAREGYSAYPVLGIEGSRRQYAAASKAFGFDGPAGVATETLSVSGRSGSIGMRRYVPETAEPGAIVYFHGGGWAIGDLDTHDSIARRLASASRRAVVSVDYRLAPEHPFPAPVEDAEDAVLAVIGSCEYDPGSVSVAGDSAGATLAIAAARFVARAGGAVACQLLVYPVIDLSGESFRRAALASDGRLPADAMNWFLQHYGAHDTTDPRFSPGAGEVVHDPPTLVVTAGDDILRPEGIDYVNRLRAAGIAVEHLDFAGHPHGFFTSGSVVGAASTVIDAMASFVDAATTDDDQLPVNSAST